VLETTVRPRAGNGVSRRQNPSMRVTSFAVPVADSRRLTRPRKQSPSRKALCRPYVPFGGGPPPGFLLPLSRVPLERRSSVDIASLIPKSDGRFFILNWLVCKLDKYSFSSVMQASKCDFQTRVGIAQRSRLPAALKGMRAPARTFRDFNVAATARFSARPTSSTG
jgi:hypothetical protein